MFSWVDFTKGLFNLIWILLKLFGTSMKIFLDFKINFHRQIWIESYNLEMTIIWLSSKSPNTKWYSPYSWVLWPKVIIVRVPSIKIPVFLLSIGQREIGNAYRIIILISLIMTDVKKKFFKIKGFLNLILEKVYSYLSQLRDKSTFSWNKKLIDTY